MTHTSANPFLVPNHLICCLYGVAALQVTLIIIFEYCSSTTEYLYTYWCCTVDDGGVMKSIGEADNWVTLVCVVPVSVRHNDLQSYVFFRRSDDCNTVLPTEMVRIQSHILLRVVAPKIALIALFLRLFFFLTWRVIWKHLDYFVFFWNRTWTVTQGYFGRCCPCHSPCLLRKSRKNNRAERASLHSTTI